MWGPPDVLLALRAAADSGDLARVRGIVAFLLAGNDAPDAGGGQADSKR
jgi:hypothetical protein